MSAQRYRPCDSSAKRRSAEPIEGRTAKRRNRAGHAGVRSTNHQLAYNVDGSHTNGVLGTAFAVPPFGTDRFAVASFPGCAGAR